MKKEYLEIGKIVSTHALKGEVRVQPWCDGPEFISDFKTLYFDKYGKKAAEIISSRPHKNVSIVKIKGVDTPEQAQLLRGKILYIKRDDARLDDGSYFIAELFDCQVIDYDDENLIYGTLVNVTETGANDVWYIKKDDKEYLIPAIPQVVKSVDVEAGIIRITPLKGIFDGEVNGDED